MNGPEDVRPDRHALLELDGLLEVLGSLRDEADELRFEADDRYRWLLHRLWIAVGNEAHAYANAIGRFAAFAAPWADLYRLRNHLAHRRLPDIDEARVRQVTWLRLDHLRRQVRAALR